MEGRRAVSHPAAPDAAAPVACKGVAADGKEIERRIALDLQCVLEAIRQAGKGFDAVLLSGSLGRGEPTIAQGDGGAQLLSDYDVFVVTDAVSDFSFFRRLETPLAERLWGSHASLGLLSTSGLPTIPCSVWSYDVKYGSRIVEGDPAMLDAMPAYQPADIPAWEGLKLLFNYSGVLLDALGAVESGPGRFAAEMTELRSSIVRLAYRLGDALAILEGRYRHLLSERRDLLPAVRAFGSLEETDQRMIRWGYEEKLRPQSFRTFDLEETQGRLLPLVERILRLSLRQYLGSAESGLPALLAEYRRRFPASPPGRFGLRRLGARLMGRRAADLPESAGSVDRSHYILSVVPIVLLASARIPGSSAYREEACRLLGVRCAAPGRGAPDPSWRAVQANILRLWKSWCL